MACRDHTALELGERIARSARRPDRYSGPDFRPPKELAKFSTQAAVQKFGVTRRIRSARFSGLSQRAVSPGVYAGEKTFAFSNSGFSIIEFVDPFLWLKPALGKPVEPGCSFCPLVSPA